MGVGCGFAVRVSTGQVAQQPARRAWITRMPTIVNTPKGTKCSNPTGNDKQHCDCWYNDESCCACGDKR